jgi:hypothetical protein
MRMTGVITLKFSWTSNPTVILTLEHDIKGIEGSKPQHPGTRTGMVDSRVGFPGDLRTFDAKPRGREFQGVVKKTHQHWSWRSVTRLVRGQQVQETVCTTPSANSRRLTIKQLHIHPSRSIRVSSKPSKVHEKDSKFQCEGGKSVFEDVFIV